MLDQCGNCKVSLKGQEKVAGYGESSRYFIPSNRRWTVPAYCSNCGKPHPWTEKALEAVQELIDETEGLSKEDKDKLKQSIPDLLTETPKTAVAPLAHSDASDWTAFCSDIGD